MILSLSLLFSFSLPMPINSIWLTVYYYGLVGAKRPYVIRFGVWTFQLWLIFLINKQISESRNRRKKILSAMFVYKLLAPSYWAAAVKTVVRSGYLACSFSVSWLGKIWILSYPWIALITKFPLPINWKNAHYPWKITVTLTKTVAHNNYHTDRHT